jgi:Uma2 family endonuclease
MRAMNSIASIIENIRHSPQLPQIVATLGQQLNAEKAARHAFYQQMTEQEKVEFIDGQVILHSPARNRHLDVVMNIGTLLRVFVHMHSLGSVKLEKCLCSFPRNDYEPDVVFFGPAKSTTLTNATLIFPVPDMAVEVLSESTESRDRGVKFQDFAANGVQEYWIVDSEANFVEQYVLHADEYRLSATLQSSDVITCQAVAGFEVKVSAFFDADANLIELKRLM